MRLVTVAACTLNQWALDFDGNLERIKESILEAKDRGASLRVGPELEICGYMCEDHFYEMDTCEHCWESLADILRSGVTDGILCDIGMPVIYGSCRYNCRIYVRDGEILHVRPKLDLADDGNYREGRWFSPWPKSQGLKEMRLPDCVKTVNGQEWAPIGEAAIDAKDALLGTEMCEELFTPHARNVEYALNGVEIFMNGSGSHHQLRKLQKRLDLILGPTAKSGGVYIYANLRGCDGARLYFDGCSCIAINGELVAQGDQFSMNPVEVISATVDLDEVTSYRTSMISLCEQANTCKGMAKVSSTGLCESSCFGGAVGTTSLSFSAHIEEPEAEIAKGPACWLWDYLRRSGANGFVLPLSGGADSSSTAAVVGCMCRMACAAAERNAEVAETVRRLMHSSNPYPLPTPKELAGAIFTTLYLRTKNSSEETRLRAEKIASEIGSRHLEVPLDGIIASTLEMFRDVVGKTPSFAAAGGTQAENLALQNLQARLRMVVTYLFAALIPWIHGRKGFYLVLGSANVDESLWGYLTKYDCSSADINPIGGISKVDLKSFLLWAAKHQGFSSLAEVVEAKPTAKRISIMAQAELEPLREGQIAQTDEDDMGMTYSELSTIGRLRKLSKCGPVSMFRILARRWKADYSPKEVAEKVKRFFGAYGRNRHKATTLTPSYHAEGYSPDDNRFDLRPFLYPTSWQRQFRTIDYLLNRMKNQS